MTDQNANRIDQMLTRSLKHGDSDAGLFTMHIHFPINAPLEKVKILDDLINKLIHQHLKKHLVWDNVVTLETLVNRFKDGEKVVSFDANGSDDDRDQSFRYLNILDENPVWVDRTGSYICDATEPLREVIPIFIERNVIPQKSAEEAKNYYSRIDKYIRKKAMKNGFLLISQMPQVLVTVNSKETKSFIVEHSKFHPKDIEETFKASLNFDRYPLMVVNSSKNASSRSVRDNTRPTHVVNVVDIDPNFVRREPLSTFTRSEVLLHSPLCRSLIVLSFGQNQLEDEVVQKINSTFFDVSSYERHDRSVLVHQDDLNGDLSKSEVIIKWLNDREIATLFANIDEILRSSDSILHDILLRSYRLRKLLALSVNETLSKVVLNEILTGECELIPQHKGLGSYYLPEDHLTLLKKLFTQIVTSVQRAYAHAGIAIEKFDSTIIAPFITGNEKFMALVPPTLRQRFCNINQIESLPGKILVCDHLLIRELEEHRESLLRSTVLLAWIEPFFKSNHIRFKRYSIEHRLARYDVQRHVLREKLLTHEEANQQRLNAELSALKLEPSITMVDLDLTSGDDSTNDQTRYRIQLSDQSYVIAGGQRVLIRMQRSKWELLPVNELIDHFAQVKGSTGVDHIDARAIGDQLLERQSTQIFDWREKLRAKVAVTSVDAAFKSLTDLAVNFDCRMVSLDWFSKDWLAHKDGTSIPNQKGLLLVLGEFLSLDRHVLRTMQIQKLNEKMQQAEINRGLLLLMKDIVNLMDNAQPAKYYELAKRIMSSDHLGASHQFFRKFMALSQSEDELIKELIQLMSEVKKNVTIKKIKAITKL